MTKEEIIKILQKHCAIIDAPYGYAFESVAEEIMKLQSLPGDEEIEKEFSKQGYRSDYVEGKIKGAIWMRDKLTLK